MVIGTDQSVQGKSDILVVNRMHRIPSSIKVMLSRRSCSTRGRGGGCSCSARCGSLRARYCARFSSTDRGCNTRRGGGGGTVWVRRWRRQAIGRRGCVCICVSGLRVCLGGRGSTSIGSSARARVSCRCRTRATVSRCPLDQNSITREKPQGWCSPLSTGVSRAT